MQAGKLAAASVAALVASVGALAAQDAAPEGATSDGMVTISVEGAMVEVPVSLAAQACGMEEREVMAYGGLGLAEDAEATVTPDASETTEDVMGAGEAGGTAEELAAADVADEAETAAGLDTDASGEADVATEADQSADSATADATAETVGGLDEAAENAGDMDAGAVCEIDQATADQHGVNAAGATSGG